MSEYELGYTKKLCILPFDHRSYFVRLLGFQEPLTAEQQGQLAQYKKIIYEGYERALTEGVSRDDSAILVDDVFGLDILLDAKNKGYVTLQSTEVSGIDHFEFEHGEAWQQWIEKVHPTFAKVLVRYNPEGSRDLNALSLDNLKQISAYTRANGYKLLIEALVPATDNQLMAAKNDKVEYDRALRPSLTVRMIEEMRRAGIEPDVWKIEGMYSENDYSSVVRTARADGRKNVGIVTLGRNETDEVVEQWLQIGARVPGVIGFAVGRTIFLDALMKFRDGSISRDEAIADISKRYVHFYKVFNS